MTARGTPRGSRTSRASSCGGCGARRCTMRWCSRAARCPSYTVNGLHRPGLRASSTYAMQLPDITGPSSDGNATNRPGQLHSRQSRRPAAQERRLDPAGAEPDEQQLRRAALARHRDERQPVDGAEPAQEQHRADQHAVPDDPLALCPATAEMQKAAQPAFRRAARRARRPSRTWSGRSTTRWISFSITEPEERHEQRTGKNQSLS